MTTLVSDDFATLGSGVSLSGRTPSPTSAGTTWKIAGSSSTRGNGSGQVIIGNSGTGALYANIDGGTSNYTVSVDAVFSSVSGLKVAGVIAAVQDASTGTDLSRYMAWIRSDSGVFQISKLDNTGARTDPGGAASTSFSPSISTTYTIALTVNGSSLSATVNGGSSVTLTDSTFATRQFGGFTSYFSDTGDTTTFDNFTISSVATASDVVPISVALNPLGTNFYGLRI